MRRRTFLELLGAAPLALRAAPGNPMDRIAVSTWSLHPFFASTRGKGVADGSLIKLLDFFGIVNKRWGVRNFECVSVHFESDDWEYLTDVRKAVEAVGGRIWNMPCDIRDTNLSSEEEGLRQ